jgi:hypothetical protein
MDYYHKYQKYRLKYLNLLNKSGGSNNNNNNNADVTAATTTATTDKNKNNNNDNVNDNVNVQLQEIIDDYNKNIVTVDVKIILDLIKKVKKKEEYKTLLEILKIKQFDIEEQKNLLNMDIKNRKEKLSNYDIQQNQKYKNEKVQEKQDLITKLKKLNDTEFNKIIDSELKDNKLKDKEYYSSLIKYIVDKYSNENKILNIDFDSILLIAAYARNSEVEDKLFELLKKKSELPINSIGGSMRHHDFASYFIDFEKNGLT